MNPEKAKDCLKNASFFVKTRNDIKALKEIRKIIKDPGYGPDNVDAYLLGAQLCVRMKKPLWVLEFIDSLHNRREFKPTVKSLILKAKAELLLGHHEDCDNTLQEIYAQQRDFVDAVCLEGELFLHTGELNKSITIFKSLVDRYPDNTKYVFNLSQAYYMNKQFGRAITYITTLIDAGIGDPRVSELYQLAMSAKKDEYIRKENIKFYTKPLEFLRVVMFDEKTQRELKAKSISETRNDERDRDTLMDEKGSGALNKKAAESFIPALYVKRTKTFFQSMMDIDYFKGFNDVYKRHIVGDIVIKKLVEIGNKYFPERFFRVGGEEFVWCFDGDLEACLKTAEDFRQAIEKQVYLLANKDLQDQGIREPTPPKDIYVIHFPVTISQGICVWGKESDGIDYKEVYQACDNSLYRAKDLGRNAVVFRGEMKFQGQKPVKYTADLVAILNEYCLENFKNSWWEYISKINEKKKDEILEVGRNIQMERERQVAASKK